MNNIINRQNISPLSQFALLLGLCGAGLIVGGLLTLLVANLFLSVPLNGINEAILNPVNAELAKLLQVVGTFTMMALPAILFAIIVSRKPVSFLGFNTSLSFKQIILTTLIMFAALFASDLFGEFNKWIPLPQNMAHYFKQLEDGYNLQVMALTNMKTNWDYLLSTIVIALMPAMFEEMVFRGCLQQVMVSISKNAFWGILITSILFSAFHQSYYGFFPRLFLGMALGYVFYFSKNIWLAILAHFINNAVGVTQIYFISQHKKLTLEAMNDNFPWYYGLVALAAMYFLFVVYKKESEKVIQEIIPL